MSIDSGHASPAYELYRKAVYVVDISNRAAWSVMMKLAEDCRPGCVIPVTAEEFDALKDGIIVLLPPPPADHPRIAIEGDL
jgi:hypothetical protein